VCYTNNSPDANRIYPWGFELGSDFWLEPTDVRLQTGFIRGASFASVTVPHWSLIPLFACVVAATWIRWTKRFSLRTLLIVVTLIAVTLGIVTTIKSTAD
jgi:hypothetical protein